MIFNLYYYVNLQEIITEVGVVAYEMAGSDEQKIAFLRSSAKEDLVRAIRFPLPDNIKIKIRDTVTNGIDHTSYSEYCTQGHESMIFIEIFRHYNLSNIPLYVITPVINGEIHVEGFVDVVKATSPNPSYVHIEKQDDWFWGYIDQEGFHLDRLINDDFFAAIKLTYNARHYVSSIKLLMICIDSIAYLEYGDRPGNFKDWLSTYADLDKINITPEELWEFRNSILHMTNLDSKKVRSNKVTRLNFYVAHPQFNKAPTSDEGKHFNFRLLLDIVAVAIARWTATFNTDKDKFEIFVNRYDRVISDMRMTAVYHTNKFDG